METFDGYQLTLSFYKNGAPVKDYTKKETPVGLSKNFNKYINTKLAYTKKDDTKATDFGDMNLSSLSYRKQLYSPNRIDVSIECSSNDLKSSMLDLAALFKEARAKLVVAQFTEKLDGYGKKTRSVDDTKAIKIAENYEVYESSPRYDSSQKKMYIDLVIYSPDKVLDTFEYSKAYTNKRLGLDIFRNEAFVVSSGGVESAFSSPLGLECTNMQVLRLKTGEEFSQPYLVQYNESFYSFLSRVANRCGEFLYYDDDKNKLILGVKPIEVKKVNNTDTPVYDFTDSAFNNISLTDFNTSHNRETDLEDFYNNYMVNAAQTPSKSFVRSSELSGNEYFETVTKDKFSSTDDERKFVGYGLYNTVGTIFTNTMGAGLFLAGVNIIKQNTWDVSQKAKAVNKHFNEKFFKGVKDTTKRLFGSADALSSISTNKVNVNSVFYPLVRNKEMGLNRSQVSLETTDISKDVMLGDRIQIFGKEYVVVKVTASFSVGTNNDGTTGIRQPVKVTAVPVVGAPMPTYSVEPIRKVGCQKAIVTDVDDPSFLGRVRVRFSWQKENDDSSPWIRVCTQMANSNGGAVYFKAAVGDSVLIDFENGNADMPYVAGFLPTMAQQKNKGQYLSRRNSVVVSSEHGQMMLMSDPTSGSDFIGAGGIPLMRKVLSFLPSDKPIKTRFLGSTEFTDYYGIYSVKMSSSDRSVTIDSPFGNVAMNAFTGISINAPNGDINIAGKNITLTAGNNITIESGVNAKPGSTRYYADLILGGAADFVTDTLMPMVLDLSYLRKVIEIFIKPCEGTLSLKSGRYLLMQAGGAEPKVPKTGFVIPKDGTVLSDPERDKVAGLLNALNFIEGAARNIVHCIPEIQIAVSEFKKTWENIFFYKDLFNEVQPKIKKDKLDLEKMKNKINADGEPFKAEDFELEEDYISQLELDGVNKSVFGYIMTPEEKKHIIEQLVNTANNMVERLRGVVLSTGFKIGMDNEKKTLVITKEDGELQNVVDKFLKTANFGNYKTGVETALKDVMKWANDMAFDLKFVRRVMAKAVLDSARNEKIAGMVNDVEITLEDIDDDKKWEKYINDVFPGESHGFLDQLGAAAYNALKTVMDKLNPIQQVTGKWVQGGRKWSAERRGQILMSDTEGTTMYFNNGTLKSFSNSDLYAVRSYCKKFL